MSYNLLELVHNGETTNAVAGVTTVVLTLNPGPDIRVYTYVSVRHTDVTDRICGIQLISAADGSHIIEVATPRLLTSAVSNEADRLAIRRSIVVFPGDQLRGSAEAMSTAGVLTIEGTFVEVPQGQTLDGVF